MTRGTCGRLTLLGLAVSLSIACGGSDGPQRATLTEDGCTFTGRSTAEAGRFEVEVENRTLRFASFGLIALGAGQTTDEIELAFERISSRELTRSRLRTDSPPPYGRWIVGADVGPSAAATLPVDTADGRYVVACFVHSNSDERLRASEIPPHERAYVAAELEVTGTPTYP